MYASGDFADDLVQYRKLFDRYNQRYEKITTKLGEYESLPSPKVVSKHGFIDSLDFTTKRELLAELLEIECAQAERPAVRSNAAKRLKLRFRTGTELRELTVI